MLWILCLVLCGLLAGTRADPGALLRLGMDIMNHGEWGQGDMGQVIDSDFSSLQGLSIYHLQRQSRSNKLLLTFHSTEGKVEAKRK